MRLFALILPLILSGPAFADVTHSIDARFGVSYRQDPSNPTGTARALYEGRYTTSFTHRSDGGLRFRFDLGIVVGNMDDTRRPRTAPQPQAQDIN